MKTKGFFWHIHHDRLMEWSDDINERIEYIKKNKTADEVETRLRLLRPVEGNLPAVLIKAWEAHEKAWEATYEKAQEAHEKAQEAHKKAWEAYDKAGKAYGKAWEACKRQIEELHRKECPNCPWDGKTMFPKPKLDSGKEEMKA